MSLYRFLEACMLYPKVLEAKSIGAGNVGIDDNLTGNMIRGDLGQGENFYFWKLNSLVNRREEPI